jgi:multidrug efflux pump subunit AcrA (membrane-fusion protein)
MTLRKKLLIGGGVLLVIAAVVYANFRFTRTPGKPINVETLKTRDLEATVSASGKIQAKRTVNIGADTVGRITKLAVEEGDRVKLGQFLMQVDPRIQEAARGAVVTRTAARRDRQFPRSPLARARDPAQAERPLGPAADDTRIAGSGGQRGQDA